MMIPMKELLDARYAIQQEYCGYVTKRWVVRFCGELLAHRETEQQATEFAFAHKKERMRYLATNKDPDTGIAYGYIRSDKLHPETVEQLQYGPQARNLTYEKAKLDWLDDKRRAHDAALEEKKIARAELDGGTLSEDEDTEFDEQEALDEFNDTWQNDEDVHAGELDGVVYQSSWLGGALHFWIFKSDIVVETVACSPCVPGAGDLHTLQAGGMPTYGVPQAWLREEE